MQKIAIIPISEAGIDMASTLQRQLKAQAIQRTEVGAQWKNFDAFIFSNHPFYDFIPFSIIINIPFILQEGLREA